MYPRLTIHSQGREKKLNKLQLSGKTLEELEEEQRSAFQDAAARHA
jgi:hypothetical protein